MQFVGVSVLINDKKKKKFCFLSLGDGFSLVVLIDYFGVFFCLYDSFFHKSVMRT